MSEARVVHDRSETFDERHGPCGSDRVGVVIEDRVFWLGLAIYPGAGKAAEEQFRKDEALAAEIARRWNVGETQ